jgi:hypothetical protein
MMSFLPVPSIRIAPYLGYRLVTVGFEAAQGVAAAVRYGPVRLDKGVQTYSVPHRIKI